jgi:nicotinamide N-methyltransferase
MAKKAGFSLEEIVVKEEEGKWLGTMSVSNLDEEALTLRKNNCQYWVARWSTDYL